MENVRDTIHILCATDNAYVPYLGIMLTSLFESNAGEHFIIHMMTDGQLSEKSLQDFNLLMKRYQHHIEYLRIDPAIVAHFPIRDGDHVSLATYYRLFAPKLLSNEVHKILYLDGDIVIDGSIRELLSIDISDKAIAAVIDESYYSKEIYYRLNLNPAIPYTSAGVLLINLDYWRDFSVTEQCMDCLAKMPDKLLFHDQDILNVVLQDEKILLPIKWNYQNGYIRPWTFNQYTPVLQREIMSTAECPTIIHFSGPSKPWFLLNDNPYKSYFNHYKKKSLWYDTPSVNPYVKVIDYLKSFAGNLLRYLKLRPSMYIIPQKNKELS